MTEPKLNDAMIQADEHINACLDALETARKLCYETTATPEQFTSNLYETHDRLSKVLDNFEALTSILVNDAHEKAVKNAMKRAHWFCGTLLESPPNRREIARALYLVRNISKTVVAEDW